MPVHTQILHNFSTACLHKHEKYPSTGGELQKKNQNHQGSPIRSLFARTVKE